MIITTSDVEGPDSGRKDYLGQTHKRSLHSLSEYSQGVATSSCFHFVWHRQRTNPDTNVQCKAEKVPYRAEVKLHLRGTARQAEASHWLSLVDCDWLVATQECPYLGSVAYDQTSCGGSGFRTRINPSTLGPRQLLQPFDVTNRPVRETTSTLQPQFPVEGPEYLSIVKLSDYHHR